MIICIFIIKYLYEKLIQLKDLENWNMVLHQHQYIVHIIGKVAEISLLYERKPAQLLFQSGVGQ